MATTLRKNIIIIFDRTCGSQSSVVLVRRYQQNVPKKTKYQRGAHVSSSRVPSSSFQVGLEKRTNEYLLNLNPYRARRVKGTSVHERRQSELIFEVDEQKFEYFVPGSGLPGAVIQVRFFKIFSNSKDFVLIRSVARKFRKYAVGALWVYEKVK